MASAALGGLGAKEGTPVRFAWTMPSLLPLLLPWVAILLLLALPSNRRALAWFIWVPLVCLAGSAAALDAAFTGFPDEALNALFQAVYAASFGLAAVWLLGAGLARRSQVLATALTALAMVAVSLLAFVTGSFWEELWNQRAWLPGLVPYLLLLWTVWGLVIAGALNLAGRLCRRRFASVRAWLWLPVWLGALWLGAAVVVGGVTALTSRADVEWFGCLVGAGVLTLVSFLVILPFLILSSANSFYGERFKELLRVQPREVPPPAPAPELTTTPAARP